MLHGETGKKNQREGIFMYNPQLETFIRIGTSPIPLKTVERFLAAIRSVFKD